MTATLTSPQPDGSFAVHSPPSVIAQQPDRPTFMANLATVFGGQAACAVVALTIEICYARLLGPAGRGQISLCMMAIAICGTFGGLGGEIPIVVWTANRKSHPSQWLSIIWFWGLVGCATVGGLWSLVYWQWHPQFLRGITSPLALLVLSAIPISVLFTYLVALLTGMERFRDRAGLSLISQVAELSGVLVFVYLIGRTAEFAILGNLFGLCAAVLLGLFILRHVLRNSLQPPADPRQFGAAISLGLRGQLGNLAAFVNYRLDVFVVNFFLDPAQVGLYTLGVVISESLWQLPQAAATALFPRTARTLEDGAATFTCLVVRNVFFLACLLGVLMAATASFVIPFLFGARFAASVSVIWWILPGTVALAVAKVMSADLTARAKPEYNSLAAFTALGVTLALDFLLIPRMGIQGAALASSITYLLETLIIAVALKHFLQVSWKTLFLPVAAEIRLYAQIWARFKQLLNSTFARK